MAFTSEELANIASASADFRAASVSGMTHLEVAEQELHRAELEFDRAQQMLLQCRKVRAACAKAEREALKAGKEPPRHPVKELDIFAPARANPLTNMLNKTIGGFAAKGDFTPDKKD